MVPYSAVASRPAAPMVPGYNKVRHPVAEYPDSYRVFPQAVARVPARQNRNRKVAAVQEGSQAPAGMAGSCHSKPVVRLAANLEMQAIASSEAVHNAVCLQICIWNFLAAGTIAVQAMTPHLMCLQVR